MRLFPRLILFNGTIKRSWSLRPHVLLNLFVLCASFLVTYLVVAYARSTIISTPSRVKYVGKSRVNPSPLSYVAKDLSPHGLPRIVNGVEDILSMRPPKFDSRYKNPCWWRSDRTGRHMLKCLPYFHIIGVCKSGTSDLFSRLLRHPQIIGSGGFNGKETHWWSWRRFRFDVFTNAGRYMNYSSYLSTFDAAAEIISNTSATGPMYPVITGEGSPTTFWDLTGWHLIPQNRGRDVPQYTTPHCIHHLQPGQKLILLLRNPSDRLYSDYLFLYNPANKSRDDFHSRVIDEIAKFDRCRSGRSLRSCLMDRAMHVNAKVRLLVNFYAEYLKEWLSVFAAEQMLILRTEDYGRDVTGHLGRVFRYLGVDELSENMLQSISGGSRSFSRSSSNQKLGDMRPDTRALLDEFYEPYNRDLATILNDGKYMWLN